MTGERFEAVARTRRGVTRWCIKDHDYEDLIALFVDTTPEDVVERTLDLNSGEETPMAYHWSRELEPASMHEGTGGE